MTTEADEEQIPILPELAEGQELHLFLRNTGSESSSSSSTGRTAFTCTIVQAFRPFTMSPVLLVSPVQPTPSPHDHASLPARMVLKLHDRRCLSNVREKWDDDKPWSLDKECEYRRYLDDVATGSATRGDFDNQGFLWDSNEVSDGEFEAYLQDHAQKAFDAERTTYERLRALQGKKIPRLYGVVEYEIAIPDSDGSAVVTEIVTGLLLEYIPSVTLRQLVATWTARDPPLPDAVLATLCDEVVRVVDRVSDFDVLNEDVRMDNFLIREPFVRAAGNPSSNSNSGESERGGDQTVVENAVVLIDLGQCRARRPDESEEAWVQAKALEDEEGAAGCVLHSLIRKFLGRDVWMYKRSLRYRLPEGSLPGENIRNPSDPLDASEMTYRTLSSLVQPNTGPLNSSGSLGSLSGPVLSPVASSSLKSIQPDPFHSASP